jgi:hypothetical protein
VWVTPFATAISDVGGRLLASARLSFPAVTTTLDALGGAGGANGAT